MKTEIYLLMLGDWYVYRIYSDLEDPAASILIGSIRANVDLMFRTPEEATRLLTRFPSLTLFKETTTVTQVEIAPTQKREDRYS